jgi:HAD superfamily hydrolase (TIGR01509 family)
MTTGALGNPTVLLCDADGNLFPSEEPAFVASAVVTNAFLAHHGVAVRFEAEQLRLATTGKNFRATMGDLACRHGIELDADEVAHWVAEERRTVTTHLAATLRHDPAVLDPLTRLSKRFTLAAVSSSATARLDACFSATGLSALVPGARRFSAEDSLLVPLSKPDPAIYIHACSRLGVDPATAIAVEDSVPGAQSAVAAGVPTIGNVQFVPIGERQEREGALRRCGVAAVVASWAELEAILASNDFTAESLRT